MLLDAQEDYELDEISKKLEEKGKELDAMKDGRPIPRGKVRQTEEQRKIRHKLRHEEEERKQKEWKAVSVMSHVIKAVEEEHTSGPGFHPFFL